MMKMIQPMSLPDATPEGVICAEEERPGRFDFLHQIGDTHWVEALRLRQATAFTRAERRQQRHNVRD